MSLNALYRVKQGLPNNRLPSTAQRWLSTTNRVRGAIGKHIDVNELLSKPTWSVASLLPKSADSDSTQISSKQLRHLLNLSALPPPKDDAEEAKMIQTLSSQLHFVDEIQKADTTGVQPLQSLRDETAKGEQEAELGLEALKKALVAEDVRGKFHPRIRRRRGGAQSVKKADEWNVLGAAGTKTGRYFVVEGGK